MLGLYTAYMGGLAQEGGRGKFFGGGGIKSNQSKKLFDCFGFEWRGEGAVSANREGAQRGQCLSLSFSGGGEVLASPLSNFYQNVHHLLELLELHFNNKSPFLIPRLP